MKKVLGYLKLILCGMVFGVANVIPGVSGGTMLVVFGIYDQLTEAISGVKAIIKNIVFLIFFGAGAEEYQENNILLHLLSTCSIILAFRPTCILSV